MCKFFSCISDGKGTIYYFNWKERQLFLKGKIKQESPDSHTSIADYHGFTGEKEDKMNKYEYNPLTKIFTVDQINTTDDRNLVKEALDNWDWKNTVPLKIKPIVHPLYIKRGKVTKNEIGLLKQWASVGASVWDSARASAGDSVWDSVWDSAGASVWDSVRAYISSFYDIKLKYDFSPCIKLWEAGLVPSFDGKIWRLHSGKKATIVYEMEIKK